MQAASLTYQSGSHDSALVLATGWLEGLLLGSLGTAIAVLAVAGVGAAMLWGGIPLRIGLKVVLGCFVLFGASHIANGLVGLANQTRTVSYAVPIEQFPLQRPQMPSPPPANPDPYAGASVPM